MVFRNVTSLIRKDWLFRSTVVFCIAVVASFPSNAQTVEIDWVQVSNNELIVHYNLDDENPAHVYTINLFSSYDDFAAPLQHLSGDHGNEVKAGVNRQIRWRITEELGLYAGPIELEVRAKMYIPFVKMTEFNSNHSYKRGKNYPLVWRSGNPAGHVDIELYLADTRVHSDRNVPNTGKFDWQVPASAKPSGGYRLKFTNNKNREETFYTPPFKVSSKIPRVAKLVAGVALVGVSIILFSSEKGNSNLPDVPNPPNQP
jgi:hypothetical protein